MTDGSRRYVVPALSRLILSFPDFFRSVYASAPFKFIVDGEPLYIHAELVSLYSKPLDRMINGHMAEAQRGFATLEDVDTGTFVRFIEWAHRGYYTAAEFTAVEIESPPTATNQDNGEVEPPAEDFVDFRMSPPVREAQNSFDFATLPAVPPAPEQEEAYSWPQPAPSWLQPGPSQQKAKKVKKGKRSIQGMVPKTREELKEVFINRRFRVSQSASEAPPPRPNQHPGEDYTDVFLSHVQLYVFADKYDIQSLRLLASEELHATLAVYTLYPARTGDIVALLRYVYRNTGQDGSEEDLRRVLTIYVGYEMDTLINDEDFRDLIIEDGGPLLGDFLTMVGRRISSAL